MQTKRRLYMSSGPFDDPRIVMGQPDKVPEVKSYTGWEHMQCNMDAGRKGY
ncbi:hypothetical protein [Atlantibacter hermannii]|uniref:hypothetical protein n=1 Tax=Atlantibacter hermannii TaxID=565 RepID=UPI0034D3CD7C